ncbi:MAG: HD domain-containing protein [Bacteroidetes bacterium]|nr:HD domain-containing protein [Bacteroidota bacterium]MBL7103575.1 HD domain-containing protein [Bacteroidales bacterium]
MDKRKIINDPVYGFINIPDKLIFDLIEHPYFQRLRRIKQLGLTHLIYPGALHTRFHHSIGAMHLMQQALSVLKAKGHKITKEEEQGALIAILLHDIGHGPFSHALENSIIRDINHEDISKIFMYRLNSQFDGMLSIGIDIFRHKYPKNYLSQLVSSQLDMDRLDYMARDSFFTGVSEGIVSTERIIKMLDMSDDKLVVEAKGIYSLEKFIVARRLMYWQVYLHKTVLSAENMLMKILKRAEYLVKKGIDLFATPSLKFFLENNFSDNNILSNPEILEKYSMLDDFDIFTSIKVWTNHEDKILAILSSNLVNRKLFKCKIQPEPFDYFYIEKLKEKIITKYNLKEKDLEYFFYSDTTSNYAYNLKADKINILFSSGKILDIVEASDQLNISVLSQAVTKHFICYPKDVDN